MTVRGALTSAVLASALFTACAQTPAASTVPASAAASTAASAPPATAKAPSGSPLAIGLQAAELPGGLTRCPQSGDPSASTDKDVQFEWSYQQKQGAVAGYAQVFTDSPSSCTTVQTIPSNGPSGKNQKILASIVLQYADEASARKAAGGGVFGVNPVHDIQPKPGAVVGSATGLGDYSFYLYQPGTGALGLALWQRKSDVVAIVAIGFAESDVKKAAAAVYGRMP